MFYAVLQGMGARTWPHHAAALLLLTVLLLAVYHPVLDAYFMVDDPYLLQATIAHGPWRHFIDPSLRLPETPLVLMPWLHVSFFADYRLFGLEPAGYYAHQLLALWLMMTLLYAALSGLAVIARTVALGWLLLAAPAAQAAQFLMTRHYLEGMCLALLAILCQRRAQRHNSLAWAVLAACCYGGAASAKEIFVPLPVLFLLMRPRRLLVPHVLCAALYVGWRAAMLGAGHLLTGYGDTEPLTLDHLLALPRHLVALMGWQSSWLLVLELALVVTALMELVRHRKPVMVILVAAGILLPLLAVVPIMQPRFLLVPAVWIAVGLALAMHRMALHAGRLWVAAGGIGILCCQMVAMHASPAWANRDYIVQYRLEGRYVMEDPAAQHAALLAPIGHAYYYAGLLWMRRHLLHGGPGPVLCKEPCLCAALPPRRALSYRAGVLHDVSWPSPCPKPSHELEVQMTYHDRQLSWRFGPYAKGRYLVLLNHPDQGLFGFEHWLPPQGHYVFPISQALTMVVRYPLADGRWAATPLLRLEPAGAQASLDYP